MHDTNRQTDRRVDWILTIWWWWPLQLNFMYLLQSLKVFVLMELEWNRTYLFSHGMVTNFCYLIPWLNVNGSLQSLFIKKTIASYENDFSIIHILCIIVYLGDCLLRINLLLDKSSFNHTKIRILQQSSNWEFISVPRLIPLPEVLAELRVNSRIFVLCEY